METTTEDRMLVATTIKSQITFWTLAACGARQFVGDENSLTFRVMSKNRKMKVELTVMDEYTVTLWRIFNGTSKLLDMREDVQCDNLDSVVYSMVNKR